MKEHPFSTQILRQFFEDKLPEPQRKEVLAWISSLPEAEQLEIMDMHFAVLENMEHSGKHPDAADFTLIIDQIISKERLRKKFIFQSLAVAASLLPLLLIYFFAKQPAQPGIKLTTTGITPISQIVTLSNHLKTNRVLQLPDSSTVSLYPGASLNYNTAFNSKKREVKLSGKAFFKIRHNELKPFSVETGDIKTVVLGTSFWVEAVRDAKTISVKVKTGKVGVVHDRHPAIFLLPSEKAVFNISSGVLAKVTKATVQKAKPAAESLPEALVFNRTPLKQVAQVLAEDFRLTIDIEEGTDISLPVSIHTKGKTISAVLAEIKLQIPIDYEIKDKHITIRKQE